MHITKAVGDVMSGTSTSELASSLTDTRMLMRQLSIAIPSGETCFGVMACMQGQPQVSAIRSSDIPVFNGVQLLQHLYL